MNRPTGNVTFLFTDIEGSTRLAQEFPDSLPIALDKHHSIMHRAIESNNGFVFEIVGDAFCCAFERAEDAVKAAVDAQKNLSNEKWDDVRIKIRIGIHTGNVEWNGKRYMGYITLARTARVMSAAYGEQIIISNDAYELCFLKPGFRKDSNPANHEIRSEGVEEIRDKSDTGDILFRDLGERRLKDLKQPVRLYQVISDGLVSDFPPIKTLDARPNNLPVQLTSFVGREEEMKLVKDMLRQTHLLTLTGTGGAGKTRFALQVGADVIDDFANGVWFVELASLFEKTLLPQEIMKVFGVKEEPKRSLEDTLCDYLRDKEMLIILDNCEHVVESCAKLTEKLLSNSPKLKIVATSREALRCHGEQTHRTLSLEVPDPEDENSPDQLSQYESVRLFIERALSVDSAFRVNNNNAPALAGICYQLDGIPLAIELAAARTKFLSVEKIHDRLSDRFNLLTGGKRTALPRQQTLRALIDWSYDLLSDEEKILWRRLSVFAGGWTLEAAEGICSDERIKKEEVFELLFQLAEKSIIIIEKDKDRYGILETLKQYGIRELKDSNEEVDIFSKHLSFFRELAEVAEPKLSDKNQKDCLKLLDSDIMNLKTALNWSIHETEKEEGLRLGVALGRYWRIKGDFFEGKRFLGLLRETNSNCSKALMSNGLNWEGVFETYLGNYEQAEFFHEASLKLGRELKDKQLIATSINDLGMLSYFKEESSTAMRLFEESLEIWRELEAKSKISTSLSNMGILMQDQGEYEKAEQLFLESIALYEETGNSHGVCGTKTNLGVLYYEQGDFPRAQLYYEDALCISRELGDKRAIAALTGNLGSIEYEFGRYESAQELHKESLKYDRDLGDCIGTAITLFNLGKVLTAKSDFTDARVTFEESLAISRKIGHQNTMALALKGLGDLNFEECNYENSKKCYEESLILSQDNNNKFQIAECLFSLGYIGIEYGEFKQADRLLKESLALCLELGIRKNILHNILGISRILLEERLYEEAAMLLGVIQEAKVHLNLNLEIKQLTCYNLSLSIAREELSHEIFTKHFEDGRNLQLEQAAKIILKSKL